MNHNLNVVFFGDSICFGQGVSLYKGWIPRIAKNLGDIYSHSEINIVTTNTSVNGRTSRQALESMPYEVQSQSPDILLIQFGMNDCNYWETDRGLPRVSPAAFKANLSELIDRGQNSGAKKIILNTNHPTTRTTTIFPFTKVTYNESNLKYNEIIRGLGAETPNVILNDIELYFNEMVKSGAKMQDFLLQDRLHLSEMGHNLYYDVTCPIVLSAVQSLINENV